MASTALIKKFSLIFYAPPSAVQACKTAIFQAGAGRYPGPGNYTECCWSAMGTGQFRPGDAANPHIGQVGALEETPEVRVETLCLGEDVVKHAVAALKSAHPYEEPAYHVIKLEDY
ncbi:GTP cyclohydrolase 1 type 2/Nif3 [Xylariaceae sp. FL0662B]|nr:GTP cyclohydrolase 1 type 2/Nif3 [Xylariaceae sp. FL0662B]